jgi:hypothetical protein
LSTLKLVPGFYTDGFLQILLNIPLERISFWLVDVEKEVNFRKNKLILIPIKRNRFTECSFERTFEGLVELLVEW